MEHDRIREMLAAAGDRGGHTLLMCAARYCRDPAVVQDLVAAGASVNDRDSAGMTPVLYAARYNDNPEICRVLLAAGADVDAADEKGRSGLDLSRFNPNAETLADVLKAAGCRPGPGPSHGEDLAATGSALREDACSRGQQQPDFDRLQEDASTRETPGLQVKLQERRDGSLVLHLDGHVDLYDATQLQRIITHAMEAGYVRLVFDCIGLEYVSSAFDLFWSASREAAKRGGAVVLARVPAKIREIYDLLGLSRLFRFCDDIEGPALSAALE